MDNEFRGYDSPEHDAAQAKCWHVIHHAINGETKRAVWEALTNARHTGDAAGLMTTMAQLSEPCEHRLAPRPIPEEVIAAVKKHAQEHYEDGGWDVVVETYTDDELCELLRKNDAYTVEDGIKTLEPLVEVWADRQADARNTAF